MTGQLTSFLQELKDGLVHTFHCSITPETIGESYLARKSTLIINDEKNHQSIFDHKQIQNFFSDLFEIYNKPETSIHLQITPFPVIIFQPCDKLMFTIEFTDINAQAETAVKIVNDFLMGIQSLILCGMTYHFTMRIRYDGVNITNVTEIQQDESTTKHPEEVKSDEDTDFQAMMSDVEKGIKSHIDDTTNNVTHEVTDYDELKRYTSEILRLQSKEETENFLQKLLKEHTEKNNQDTSSDHRIPFSIKNTPIESTSEENEISTEESSTDCLLQEHNNEKIDTANDDNSTDNDIATCANKSLPSINEFFIVGEDTETEENELTSFPFEVRRLLLKPVKCKTERAFKWLVRNRLSYWQINCLQQLIEQPITKQYLKKATETFKINRRILLKHKFCTETKNGIHNLTKKGDLILQISIAKPKRRGQ